MAKIDRQLITRILRRGKENWLGAGISEEMLSLDTRPVFVFIKQHALKHKGKPPAIRTVKQFFPAFKLCKAPEEVSFYAEKLLERHAEAKLRNLTSDLSHVLSAENPDVREALELVGNASGNISLTRDRITDVYFGKSPASRLRELKKIKKGLTADFSLGHDVLDEDLIGAEKGNFFIIAGTPGAGKTWLLLKTLYNLWLDGEDILLFSFELSKKLILRRLDSIVAEVQYSKFRRGLLTFDEERKFERALLRNAQRKNFFQIITNEDCDPLSKTGPGRLDFVYATIMRRKPRLVGVDGFYLMRGQGQADWEKIASLTRGFHNITQATGVCGWGTTQLTKTSDEKNPKLRDLSYSWTFAQDTDGAFLLSRPDDMRLSNEIAMTAAKFREAEDNLRYIVDFVPGGIIDVTRVAVETENPLME